jgi:hypothetical protein
MESLPKPGQDKLGEEQPAGWAQETKICATGEGDEAKLICYLAGRLGVSGLLTLLSGLQISGWIAAISGG